jgi:hypothetical protein
MELLNEAASRAAGRMHVATGDAYDRGFVTGYRTAIAHLSCLTEEGDDLEEWLSSELCFDLLELARTGRTSFDVNGSSVDEIRAMKQSILETS